MTIQALRSTSDRRKIGKVFKDDKVEYEVELYGEFSIMNPTFIIRNFDILTYNYIYVKQWGRFYFIEDIVLDGSRCLVKCHIDVLETYSIYIKAMKLLVERSQNVNNGFIVDEQAPVNANRVISKTILTDLIPKGESIIINTTGGV